MNNHSNKTTGKKMRIPRLTLTTMLVAIAVLAIAAVTFASRQRQSTSGPNDTELNKQAAKSPGLVTVKVAGQDVQVNSQTGQIKPLTAEEAQRLAAGLKQMVNQSTEGLVQVEHADGSVSVDLQGRFQNVTVARVNKDGSVSQSCVDNPQAAGAFFGLDPRLMMSQSETKAAVKQRLTQVVPERQLNSTPKR